MLVKGAAGVLVIPILLSLVAECCETPTRQLDKFTSLTSTQTHVLVWSCDEIGERPDNLKLKIVSDQCIIPHDHHYVLFHQGSQPDFS